MKRALLFTWMLSICLGTAEHATACPDVDGLLDANCDGKVKIVCFGDSITFGVADNLALGYPGRLLLNYAPNTEIVNLGIPGENTDQGILRAPLQFASHTDADFVVTLEGVNDYWLANRDSARTRSNLLSIKSSGAALGTFSLLSTLTPIRRDFQRPWVDLVNSRIRSSSEIRFDAFLTEASISFDLLHPDGNGYESMAVVVKAVLEQLSDANRPVDTDADGIYDYAESRFGAVVGLADTDGDGLSDGEEVFTYSSNPANTDSDGDGYGDFEEVTVIGSNPADPKPGAPSITSFEIIP